MAMSKLWEDTRDLHHACEAHPVGAAMASGKPPKQWYSSWLEMLYQYHYALDPHLPESVHRAERLSQDMISMDTPIEKSDVAKQYAATLVDEKSIAGASYVLTGAHLMGGEVMRRRLDGYPVKHLEWDDRKIALSVLQTLRVRTDISKEARDCFKALLDGMDEIVARYPVPIQQEALVV
jgi:heme oxygenase